MASGQRTATSGGRPDAKRIGRERFADVSDPGSRADGATAGELTLSGGLGFHPVSFSGLVRHDGWKLQRRTDGDWETVDQSSSAGNDWWQATHDPASDTWTLTYSVPLGDTQELRLVYDPS